MVTKPGYEARILPHIFCTSASLNAEFVYHVQKKADYIKRATAICAEKYNGDIPPTFEGLVSKCAPRFGAMTLYIVYLLYLAIVSFHASLV